MTALDQYFNNKIRYGTSKEDKIKDTNFKQRNAQKPNLAHFELVPRSNSGEGVLGVATQPTNVIQLKMNSISIPIYNGIIQPTIYVQFQQFAANSISSPYGFNYHFKCSQNINMSTLSYEVLIPDFPSYYLDTPITNKGALTFSLFTETEDYNPPQDQYDCYIDYSGPNYTFNIISNVPVVIPDGYRIKVINCILPVDGQQVSLLGNKAYKTTINGNNIINTDIAFPVGLQTNINRPADQSLGIYSLLTRCDLTPGLITTITTDIPNGLSPGNFIIIDQFIDPRFNTFLGRYQVISVNQALNSFEISLDTSSIPHQQSIIITGLPISPLRKVTVQVRIVEYGIKFEFAMVSVSPTAFGFIQTIAF